MNAMLDIDIQTPDLPGQMEAILGELKQLRESNALLKKRHTEIEAYGLNLQQNLSGSRGFDRDFLNLENLRPTRLVKTDELGSVHGICLTITDAHADSNSVFPVLFNALRVCDNRPFIRLLSPQRAH
jgi:hypothetical protein